jgi:hypothetical protein
VAAVAAAAMTKKKKEKQKLPEPLETQRNYVLCGPIVNTHVSLWASSSRRLPSGWLYWQQAACQ